MPFWLERLIAPSLAGILAWLAGSLILAAVGLLGLQCYLWLSEGFWTPVSLLDAYLTVRDDPPVLTWKRLEQIVRRLLNWPLSFFLFGFGVLSFLAYVPMKLWKDRVDMDMRASRFRRDHHSRTNPARVR